jgi:bisphosphoglycerate-independent phosphoglycerate mutase (AlkP superfamily)
VYDFKSAAFQYILRNTDRRVLAEYEDLSNKLAHVTYFMDDGQKAACESDIEKIYRKRCP